MAIKTVHVKGFVTRMTCNGLVYWFNNPRTDKQIKLPLENEGNNMTNVVYESKRSKGLRYQYQRTATTKNFTNIMKRKLKELVNEEFDAPINDGIVPIFQYSNGACIKPHRDLNKFSEEVEFQHLVAVVVLTQKGEAYTGGRFYLNAKAKCSPDGKEVWDDYEEDRIYFDMDCGDLIIFDNRQFIHGVEEVHTEEEGMVGRYSCSFRTL